MFNNVFNQQQMGMAMPNNNGFINGGVPMIQNYGQNNGLNFGNVAPAKSSASTAEEMALIKSQHKSNFSFNEQEVAEAGWDYRDGSQLMLEIVDPATDKVRAKYTGEEFCIVMQPVEVLNEVINLLNNFVCTTKVTDTIDPPDTLKQLHTAWGIVRKLLPISYENGKKNYSKISQQLSQMMTASGYQGTWGNGMFNGAIGATPNYTINDNIGGMFQQGNMMNNNITLTPQQLQQLVAQQTQQQLQAAAMNNNSALNFGAMGMGTPMPTGGTMMGNPFTQNGVPQQQAVNNPAVPSPAPTPQVTPSIGAMNIPAPGTIGGANPSIGATNVTTATATV